MSMFIKKIFICILSILLLCCSVFASVVSDNDGSAFITKAEFDSLKNNFQSQLDLYNSGIDNKIDAAIASYLSGISFKQEGTFNNTYLQWGVGTDFVWGNDVGYKTSKVLGGGSSVLYVNDIRANRTTTATYDNAVNNSIFIATGNSKAGTSTKIYLKPRSHKCTYNEVVIVSFAQDATTTGHQMMHYQNTMTGSGGSTAFLAPKRNGDMSSDNKRNYTWPEFHAWHAFIRESITTSTSLCGVFSPNRTSTEYYIKEDGDETATSTLDSTASTKGTTSGDFGMTSNQLYVKTIGLSWQKTAAHNNLIIKEWTDTTNYEEQIKSGAPVAYVSEDDCQVTVTFKTNKGGTMYVYSNKDPIAYNYLGTNDWSVVADVVGAVTGEKIVLNKCVKGEYIRVIFIPSSGTGTLEISEIKYKKNQ